MHDYLQSILLPE
jgi:hypothetical protein